MGRLNRVVVVLAAGALALGVAGCVDSDPGEAQTPSDAPTVVNSAPQTNSAGETVPTPGAETSGGETTEGGGGEGPSPEAVAAGEQFFAGTCQGCHTNLGQAAGVGPQLAGRGLDEALIRTRVENGRGVMPPGLATGEDLDNVVAFVLSIQ